jgi:CRP-like cAMP-binding protein
MSKFYERWLNSQEGKDSHKKSTKERDADSLKAVDPTAMSKNLTEAKDGKGPSRRVQIINDSMDVTNSTKLVSELKTHFKTAASRSFLAEALGAHYLFENLSEIEVDKIIDCMSPLSQGSDTVIIQEGEEGDLFYCLEAGEADALVEGVGKVAHYSRGGCFGELALMYSSPRAASVISRSHCSLWTLDLKTFRSILANSSSNEQQTRVSFLEKCLFLESLNQDQLRKVAMALQHTEHPDGDIVVKQGDAGSTFYIIEAGVVKVTQLKSNGMEVELATLRQGDYFGEMALILAESRHATVSCVGPVSTLSLDQEKFNLLLGGVQGVLASRMRIRILKSVPLLSRMPESTLVRLGAALRIQTFAAGSYIIRQGDEGSRFYIISEGDIKCTRTIQGVQEEELIRLGPQEVWSKLHILPSSLSFLLFS